MTSRTILICLLSLLILPSFGQEQNEADTTAEKFTIVEQPAVPVGGYNTFYRFVDENLHYPTEARKNGIEGKVYVQFIVNEDGALSEIEVVKGIGFGCDEEVVRVVSLSPAWVPPRQRGKYVKQKIVMPITFQLGVSEPPPRTDPTPVNGWKELEDWIAEQTKLVNAEIPLNNSQGAVRVSFLVSKKGKLSDFYVEKGLGKSFDTKAIQILKNYKGEWNPGTLNHIPESQSLVIRVDFDHLPKVTKNKAKLSYDKGVDAFAAGNFKKALKHFDNAIELHPTTIDYHFNKAVVLLQMKETKDACNILDMLTEHDQQAIEVFTEYCNK